MREMHVYFRTNIPQHPTRIGSSFEPKVGGGRQNKTKTRGEAHKVQNSRSVYSRVEDIVGTKKIR
jgi:hypothetical protein